MQDLLCLVNHRLALSRVIGRQGFIDNLGLGPCEFDDQLGELFDRKLMRVAEIDRSCYLIGRRHHGNHPSDQVIAITERASLGTVTVDGNIFSFKRLNDKIRDYTSVIRVHIRAVGIEDTDDLDAHLVLAVVVKEKCLGATFALVVTRTDTNRVHVSPILLRLRMDMRVSVHFAGRSL